jgi:hypothetical protein
MRCTRIAPSSAQVSVWTCGAASLILALVVVTGLAWIGSQNLNGNVAARQVFLDHSAAVKTLLFRQ